MQTERHFVPDRWSNDLFCYRVDRAVLQLTALPEEEILDRLASACKGSDSATREVLAMAFTHLRKAAYLAFRHLGWSGDVEAVPLFFLFPVEELFPVEGQVELGMVLQEEHTGTVYVASLAPMVHLEADKDCPKVTVEYLISDKGNLCVSVPCEDTK